MCWRCVGSVAGWRWVAQPHPAPASAVPGLTALVPHCQPSPVVPRTQACTLHSAGTLTVPCCQYILWGSVCEPSVNQTPGNVPRCIQRGVFLSLFSNGEIVLKHSLLGNQPPHELCTVATSTVSVHDTENCGSINWWWLGCWWSGNH